MKAKQFPKTKQEALDMYLRCDNCTKFAPPHYVDKTPMGKCKDCPVEVRHAVSDWCAKGMFKVRNRRDIPFEGGCYVEEEIILSFGDLMEAL